MKKIFKEITIVVIANIILAIAVGMFLIPNHILTGGLAGVSLLLISFIPISQSALIFILSGTLLIIGWIFLGNKFMINTCISSILYPTLLMAVTDYMPLLDVDPILAAIYGGLLGGVGIGLVMSQSSSTGGMDIPPLLLKKFFDIDVAKSVMFFDAMTVILGLYIYGLEPVLIGLISVYATSITIDKVMTFGGIKAKSVQIISKDYLKIQEDVHSIVERGSTIMESTGGYTNEARKVLLVVVTNKQYPKLLEIINKHDKDAFVIVQEATDVKGHGFDEIARI